MDNAIEDALAVPHNWLIGLGWAYVVALVLL